MGMGVMKGSVLLGNSSKPMQRFPTSVIGIEIGMLVCLVRVAATRSLSGMLLVSYVRLGDTSSSWARRTAWLALLAVQVSLVQRSAMFAPMLGPTRAPAVPPVIHAQMALSLPRITPPA